MSDPGAVGLKGSPPAASLAVRRGKRRDLAVGSPGTISNPLASARSAASRYALRSVSARAAHRS
jgi:hypothetical protein